MIKCICDKCGKEVQVIHSHIEAEEVYDGYGNKVISVDKARYDLCDECNAKFEKLNIDIADFMEIPDKEIDLLLNTFKVGDKVVTADGLKGVITHICTCFDCKKRGFYESLVKFKNGKVDYITVSDKQNGFKSYYSIGDHVFGNLDKESVIRELNDVNCRRAQLEEQLGTLLVLEQVRENKNGN